MTCAVELSSVLQSPLVRRPQAEGFCTQTACPQEPVYVCMSMSLGAGVCMQVCAHSNMHAVYTHGRRHVVHSHPSFWAIIRADTVEAPTLGSLVPAETLPSPGDGAVTPLCPWHIPACGRSEGTACSWLPGPSRSRLCPHPAGPAPNCHYITLLVKSLWERELQA